MSQISEYFASLDLHTQVLFMNIFAWLLGFLKKMNSVRSQYLAGKIEWSLSKYLYVEVIVMVMNLICLFIIQLFVDTAKLELSPERDWPIVVGAGTIAYAGNDLIVQVFGRAKKFGQKIIDQKTNALEGEGTRTPMPQKSSDTKI